MATEHVALVFASRRISRNIGKVPEKKLQQLLQRHLHNKTETSSVLLKIYNIFLNVGYFYSAQIY